MKKIKYTPDAADKLRALKAIISQEYGVDNARKIVKNITDAIRGLSDYEEKGPEVSKIDVYKRQSCRSFLACGS